MFRSCYFILPDYDIAVQIYFVLLKEFIEFYFIDLFLLVTD